MSDLKPQNPVFKVDSSILEACLPKVSCVNCGTVICVRARKNRLEKLRCPGCSKFLKLENDQGNWITILSEDQDI